MINRWIIVLLVTLSLASGIPSPEKKESISSDSRVFLEDNSYDIPHSRQRRVGRQPDVSTNQTDKAETTTTVMSTSSTTTESSEAKDMEETSVNPKDDDDVTVIPTTAKSVDKSTTIIPEEGTSKKVIVNDNKTTPMKNETLTSTTEMSVNTATTTTVATIVTSNPVTPASKENTNITKPPDELPENATPINEASADIQEILKYTTEDADPSTENIKFHPLSTENTTSTLEPPTVTAKSREEQVEERLETKSNLELAPKTEKAGLSTGIVALIIAVAFAGIAILGFVGLQVHKRYLEYRHGNRELLVNDFDANDINNFEL